MAKAEKDSLTSKMRIDVDSVKDGEDVLEKLKPLKRINQFVEYADSGGINKNTLIKYIVLLYSDDSIYNQKPIIPLNERKLMAAGLAGFKKDKNNEFAEGIVKRVFNLEDDKIFEMVFAYLNIQNNHLWKEILTIESEIEEFQKLRMRPVMGDDDKTIIAAAERKDKLMDGVSKRITYLSDHYRTFFGDHEDVKKTSKDRKQANTLENRANNK